MVTRTTRSSGTAAIPPGAAESALPPWIESSTACAPDARAARYSVSERANASRPRERSTMARKRFRFFWKSRQRARDPRKGLVVIDHIAPERPPSSMRGRSRWPKKCRPSSARRWRTRGS